ncbi:MAG: PstS family phosphate ABC transporter substrate-binding protein [Pontiellaceae bacterium]|nr:PstS family phosphate ABC transporter substrate-binding protein [Pontiellaceae bacterium]
MKKMIAMAALAATVGSVFADDTITIDGSTTVGPIAKAFAEYYMSAHPDVKVTVSESGSGNGAKSLLNGTCDIADMSRGMKDSEFKACAEKDIQPVAHVVALDGLPILVHPSNPVQELTIEQIRDIFTGKITNWKEVGGSDMKIVMISRDTNSGTYETFETKVMDKEEIHGSCEYVTSNGQMRQRVQSTPAAIGYAGIGFVDRSVKALKVNGVAPSAKTVQSGEYPIARPLFMYTNGYPKLGSPLYQFVTIYLTEDGQELVEDQGFIPVTDY